MKSKTNLKPPKGIGDTGRLAYGWSNPSILYLHSLSFPGSTAILWRVSLVLALLRFLVVLCGNGPRSVRMGTHYPWLCLIPNTYCVPTEGCQNTKLNSLQAHLYLFSGISFVSHFLLSVIWEMCAMLLFTVYLLVATIGLENLFCLLIPILFYVCIPNAWWQIAILSRWPIRLLDGCIAQLPFDCCIFRRKAFA